MLTDSKLLTSAAWDAQSLNELKTKAGKDPAANIRPVARQVEGMFVQMMLKACVKPCRKMACSAVIPRGFTPACTISRLPSK